MAEFAKFIEGAVTRSQNTTTRFIREFTMKLREAHNNNDWNLARRLVDDMEQRCEEISTEIATQAGVAMLLGQVVTKLDQLSTAVTDMRKNVMATQEEIARVKTSIDAATTEMANAVDFIRNHPAVQAAAQSDPELAAAADRLDAAVAALKGVDVEAVASGSGSGSGSTSGAVGGVVSGGTAGGAPGA